MTRLLWVRAFFFVADVVTVWDKFYGKGGGASRVDLMFAAN